MYIKDSIKQRDANTVFVQTEKKLTIALDLSVNKHSDISNRDDSTISAKFHPIILQEKTTHFLPETGVGLGSRGLD